MKEAKPKTQIVTISGYDEDGNGIFKHGTNQYKVNNVVQKDKVEVEIIPGKTEVKFIKLIEKSPNRINPKCPIFSKCGGCQLQHINYSHQLEQKQQYVFALFKSAFKREYQVSPCLGMKYPFEYRNKNQIVFGNDRKLKIISGFYIEKTHKIINFDNCYLQDELTNKIIATFKDIMIKLRLYAYDEDRRTGLIRHVMIKRSFALNETMVIIVTGTDVFPGRANFMKMLLARHPEITTVIQNVNTRQTSAVLGDKEMVLFGKGYITDLLSGLKFKVSSKSFYQINPIQTDVLYTTAIKLAKLEKTDILLDAYSGVGTIGLIASPEVNKVISVELVKDAYFDAIQNAKLNNIKNVHFFNDDATNFMINLAKKKEKIDIVVMDPPRKGSDERFMSALLTLKPKKIIYISCNPETQVVDLQHILKDYEIQAIQPVDMFPQTDHVETVVLMLRKDK